MTKLDILIVVSYVVVTTSLLVFFVLWLFTHWGIIAGCIGLAIACGLIYVSGVVVEE